MVWSESDYFTWTFGCTGAPANTQFLTLGFAASNANEVQWPVPMACQIRQVAALHRIASGGGETITYTVRDDGADTLGVATIIDPAVDNTYDGAINVAAGSLISVQCAAGGGVGACVDVTVTVTFRILV